MPPRKTPRKELGELQSAVEGVPSDGKLEFLGETFRLADDVGIVPLLKYAHYAGQSDMSITGPVAGAMYEILRDTIHPDDWERWQDHAIAKKARADDLQAVVEKCVEILTARPTRSPSVSSNGDSAASANSTATSSGTPDAA